jgi:hypothetical protein
MYHQEDCRQEDTALTDTGLYGEWLCQFSIMDYLADGIFIKLSDDVNELWWESVTVYQLPDDLPVDAVKRLLEVNEDAVQGGSVTPGTAQ